MQHSVINFKEIHVESDIFRLDSEFFCPSILDAKRKIRSIQSTTLRKTWAKVIHPVEIKRGYQEKGIQILLAQNIRDNFLDFSIKVFMSEKLRGHLLRNKLEQGDVVMTRSGANYGQSATYLGHPVEIFACADDLIIRNPNFSGTYLATYLNTSLGKTLIESCRYGSSQPHISPRALYDIPIYKPSKELERCIDMQVHNSFKFIKRSECTYHDAQCLLLSELELAGWKPKRTLSFVKNYSDTRRVDRIDAEYYQPKYERIVKIIKNYSGGFSKLESLAKVTKSIEVGSSEYLNKGIPFVRVSNMSPFELTEEKYISENLYTKIKQYQPEQGEILFSKDATPGIAYHIREEPKKMIPSGGILRLQLTNNRVTGDYLTLVLNSLPVKEQVNRDVGGSVILHWRPDQVKEIVIPILPKEKQAQIEKKIAESFSIRKQSKHLLECAKRAVEIAIEQDEQTAIKWLKSETEKMTDMSIS